LCPVLAEQAVEKSWQDTPEDMQIKTTGNIFLLFQRLKENGIKIAIWYKFVETYFLSILLTYSLL
jgi:hypothetical protein